MSPAGEKLVEDSSSSPPRQFVEGDDDGSARQGESGGSSSVSLLSRKLQKLLSSDLEGDPELAEALAELSDFFPENTLRTRRFLRGDIERRSLQVNREFLSELGKVKAAVDEVYDVLAAMNENGKAMQAQLEQTKVKTRDLIRQTATLQAEGQDLAIQEATVNEFIDKYQLTEEEYVVLRASDNITEKFFRVLEKVRRIHEDCKGLLQSGQHSTALEIMEQMSQFEEQSSERLYRWTQSQCRSISVAEDGQMTLLARAMGHLQARPPVFQYVMDEFCAARRAALARAFIDALTIGGPGGTPRPIELHAHDPPRYVGDMLAWLHQALPSERETCQALLNLCTNKLDVSLHVEKSVASITEDVCRPLRSRVEQVLLLESSPTVLYKMTGLLRFYMGTMKQVIPETAALVLTLIDLDQLTYKQFLSVLQSTVAQQAVRAEPPGHDLAPTPSTLALLALLREVLSGSSFIDEDQEQLHTIVSTIIDPLIESLNSLSSQFPTTDQDVFMLNSFYQIHSTLSLFQFNDARLQTLQSDMQLHLDTLSSEQTSNLIANLGLQPICTMVAEHQDKKKSLATVPGMESSALKEFLAKFDSFLVAPDMFLLPQIRLLVSSAHRKNVGKRSLEVVAASYSQLYTAVMEPSNQYENPSSLMPKKPEQVAVLLQL